MTAGPLLAALLGQCIRPAAEEDCDACAAMLEHQQVVRELAPLVAGSDQCPWHQGHGQGWRNAVDAVNEVLA